MRRCRQRGIGVHAHALRVEPAARQARVIGDEFGMQQHVAVDEHQVVRRAWRRWRGCAGARARKPSCGCDTTRTGTVERAMNAAMASLRGGARAIVGDDDFVGGDALAPDAVEHGGQGIGALVRGDHQREAHRPSSRSTDRAPTSTPTVSVAKSVRAHRAHLGERALPAGERVGALRAPARRRVR